MTRELTSEEARWRCDPAIFSFKTTADLEPAHKTVGQDPALDALRIGLELYAPGYNVFVTGQSGTGRTTAVLQYARDIRPQCALAPDRCFVHNFENENRPRLLPLPRGTGREFQSAMNRLVDELQETIPRMLEGKFLKKQRENLIDQLMEEDQRQFRRFEEKAREKGFDLGRLKEGQGAVLELFPVVDGKPVPIGSLDSLKQEGKLTEEQVRTLREGYESFQKELSERAEGSRRRGEEIHRHIAELEKEAVTRSVDHWLEKIRDRFQIPAVREYLERVRAAVLENPRRFMKEEEQKEKKPGVPDPFLPFRVNLLYTPSKEEECPLVYEPYPTFTNLFGTIEAEPVGGSLYTDFTKIKSGAMLDADGGYLVLRAKDILASKQVWGTFKKVLLTRKLEIQLPENQNQVVSVGLKPEPIDVNVKVVLIGDSGMYDRLADADEDFLKIFKVKAEFDNVMDLTNENIEKFISVIVKVCREEGLCPFDSAAVARVLEHGVRISDHRRKLTTRFSWIADLVRESHHFCMRNGRGTVGASEVEEAIRMRTLRLNLFERKTRERIRDGVLLIDTQGNRVGQVNGLVVYHTGQHSFGVPSRITASTAVGRRGVINIEREARLSGRTHDKGVQILSGFLRDRFSRDKPLSLDGSICFEQSYGGVDGDSASSAEVYAILSSLSGLPIRQDLAVTGSVNQHGVIQPIGGVNEKVEGFHDVCRERGLTGTQGVLIPSTNLNDLMLRPDVVEAVRDGKFHVYAIDTVEEGIELLTGSPAGKQGKSGNFPPGSVLDRADRRLEEMTRALKKSLPVLR